MRPSKPTRRHPAARAAFEAFGDLGHPVSGDLNGAETEGVGWVEMTAVDSRARRGPVASLKTVRTRG